MAPTNTVVVKIDEKNAIVFRLSEWKGKTKVYIQGGYAPGEDFEGELLVEPNEDFPSGLAFGKAVTFPPKKLAEVNDALASFSEQLNQDEPTTTAKAPATPKAATAKTKAKGTVVGTNRVEPQLKAGAKTERF